MSSDPIWDTAREEKLRAEKAVLLQALREVAAVARFEQDTPSGLTATAFASIESTARKALASITKYSGTDISRLASKAADEIERLQASEEAWKIIAKQNDKWNALPQAEKEAALQKALEDTTADCLKAEETVDRIKAWLRRQASAEKDPNKKAAFVEAHNAVLEITKTPMKSQENV